MADNEKRGYSKRQSHAQDSFTLPVLDPGTIPALSDITDRVDYIVTLMREFKWVRGKTAKLLAKHWNVSVSTIENYSSEASRVVTANRDEAARTISLVAHKLLLNAAYNNDAKSAAAIGKLWADVSGANAPIVQEITIDSELDPAKAKALTNKLFSGGVSKDEEEDKSVVAELFDDSSTDESAQ